MHDSPSLRSEPLALPLFQSDPVARWLPAAALALVTLGGCDSDFEPYNKLTSLRVLAIESRPVSPSPGEISTLTPLLHVPDGEAVTSSWSWCPLEVAPEDDSACP